MEQSIFACPICLQVLKDPRFLMCGHGFCLSCVETYMEYIHDENGDFGMPSVYECPVCREEFYEAPGAEDPLMRMYGIEEDLEKFRRFVDEKNENLLNTKEKNEELVEENEKLKQMLHMRDYEIGSLKRGMAVAERVYKDGVSDLKRKLNTAESLKEHAYESLRVKRLRIKEMKDHATRFYETIMPTKKRAGAKVRMGCGCGVGVPDEVNPDEVTSGDAKKVP